MMGRAVPDLAGFEGAGYDKGRSRLGQAAWYAVANLVWRKWWFPMRARPAVLRAFGAHVGKGCIIRSDVRVHWPWKLSIGEHCWLGEGAWLLNLEPITIGSNVCISQDALLCTGSHDAGSPTFEFDNGPIRIADGVWIAARAVVLKGVTVGEAAIVPAGVVARSDVPGRAVLDHSR